MTALKWIVAVLVLILTFFVVSILITLSRNLNDEEPRRHPIGVTTTNYARGVECITRDGSNKMFRTGSVEAERIGCR